MSQNFDNSDIRVRVVEMSDAAEVLDFLRTHVYPEEPLTIGSTSQHQDTADEEFVISQITQGLSLMAALPNPHNSKERIVGILISGAQHANQADLYAEDAKRYESLDWGRILELLNYCERQANVYMRYGVETVLHGHLMGVAADMRGRRISELLHRETFVLAKRKDYKLFTADATSLYSAKMCERIGMECVNTVYYLDYCDDRGRQIFKPPPPHTCIKTYAITL